MYLLSTTLALPYILLSSMTILLFPWTLRGESFDNHVSNNIFFWTSKTPKGIHILHLPCLSSYCMLKWWYSQRFKAWSLRGYSVNPNIFIECKCRYIRTQKINIYNFTDWCNRWNDHAFFLVLVNFVMHVVVLVL